MEQPTNIEVAKFYGISNQTLSNWETGRNGKSKNKEGYKLMLKALRDFYLKSKDIK